MKKILYTAFYFCSALLLSSCIGDLDQYPHEDETSSTIYTSADNYKAVLGKIYAAMVTPGQEKVTYVKMTAEKALRVVNDHLVNGNVVTEYTIGANAIGAK